MTLISRLSSQGTFVLARSGKRSQILLPMYPLTRLPVLVYCACPPDRNDNPSEFHWHRTKNSHRRATVRLLAALPFALRLAPALG